MSMTEQPRPDSLTSGQRQQFIREGFLRIDNAFSPALAAEARDILWKKTDCDPHKPETWTCPVVRIGECDEEPFRRVANTPVLLAAFQELAGKDRWVPKQSLGSFPVRFPSDEDPGDTGWHVDASFAPDGEAVSYFEWRVNAQSKGRALLMLFLFSDASKDDAPTRIRIGSHLQVANLLKRCGEQGLSFMELGAAADAATAGMPEAEAVGPAGTVYLCHPFLVHAAQPHHGHSPRFMAQPSLELKEPCELDRTDGQYSAVEEAIRAGLNL